MFKKPDRIILTPNMDSSGLISVSRDRLMVLGAAGEPGQLSTTPCYGID
jgi:hypothetical protein